MMSETLIAIYLSVSGAFALPQGLLQAICYTESGHSPQAVNEHDGGSASFGVCQVKLNTARLVGFKGTRKQLQDPVTNIFFAGAYLRYQLDRYHGNIPKAIAAYNAGSYKESSPGLVSNHRYVASVLQARKGNK